MSRLFCLGEIGIEKVAVEYLLHVGGGGLLHAKQLCVNDFAVCTVTIQNICVLNFSLKLLHVSLEKETKLLISLQ